MKTKAEKYKRLNPDEFNVTVEARLRQHLTTKAKSTASKALARFYSWQRRVLQQVTVEDAWKGPRPKILGRQKEYVLGFCLAKELTNVYFEGP